MPTRASKRRTPDVGRLAAALARPGIDLRSWNAAARIDDDPDAVRWDPKSGWLVDTSPYGGELAGNRELTARALYPVAGKNITHSIPFVPGQEVALQITDGFIEANPVIVGRLHNAGGSEAPTSVAGVPIDGTTKTTITGPLGNFVSISPFDAEIFRSPYHLIEQRTGRRLTVAAKHVLEGADLTDAVLLGSRNAVLSSVLGEPNLLALGAYADALNAFASAVAAAISAIPVIGSIPGAAIATAATALSVASVAMKAGLQSALSLRVKLE